MSFDKLIADHTAALQENNTLLKQLIELNKAGVQGSSTTSKKEPADDKSTKTTSTKDTKSDNKDDSAAEETIYWHIPGTKEFGTFTSEAEFKKLKRSKTKAIKIPKSKYDTLVEKASQSDDNGEYSDRIQGLIDEIPESPDQDDIRTLFLKYLQEGLAKDERAARIEVVKSVLEPAGVAKATLVPEDQRYDVMVALVKAMETHLEETGQAEDDDSVV